MPQVVSVAIHESQFPENVRLDLLQSLRSRQVNHKFHYDSHKQTQQWLKLHQAYSPSRTDSNCASIYDSSFAAVASHPMQQHIRLIGLGCGGGQKDTRLLRLLQDAGKSVSYTPCDVSVAMTLVAYRAATTHISNKDCHPFACDLLTTHNVKNIPAFQTNSDTSRIVTFFGMIPNFEPKMILPKLAELLRPEDCLLFSANLSPGPDYTAGIARILPLYDNPLTRAWLMSFLLDLGVLSADGMLRFTVEDCPAGSGLKRIAAYFHFSNARQIELDDESFNFQPGESIRLFFSYRHTPAKISSLLKQHGISVEEQWITESQEEGVFLCRRE